MAIVSLVISIVLVFASVVLLRSRSTMTAVISTSSLAMEKSLLDQLKKRGELLIKVLAQDLANPVYHYDMEAIFSRIRSVKDQADVLDVNVYDNTSRIIHDGSKSLYRFDATLNDEISRRALDSKELTTHVGGDRLTIDAPILMQSELLGGVKVAFSLKGVMANIQKMRNALHDQGKSAANRDLVAMASMAAAFTVVGLILAVLVAQKLSEPIAFLSTVAERIGEEKYDFNIPIQRSDEIGRLATSFKEMAEKLTNLRRREKEQAEELMKAYLQVEQTNEYLVRANSDLQRKEEIQQFLKELSQDIASLDIDALLKKLTVKIRGVFGVDISDVRVRERDTWQIMGVSGIEPERLQTETTGTARGRSRWVIDNRQALLIPDISRQVDVPSGEALSRLGIRGYLGVPLFSRSGEVLGVLRALSYGRRDFTQEEVDLLQQIANGAAIALENARLLEQTRNQAAELEKANREMADFTAMIVHDLRSPLTAILGAATIIEVGLLGPITEEQKTWLAKLQTNGKRMINLMSDFLDLSKLEAGHIDLVKEEVDVERLIQNSIDNYLVLAQAKNVSLRSYVAPGLPRIHADPRRLDQVIGNLMSNAIKFTGEGGEIEVGATHDNGTEAKVWVKDSGVGIPSEEIGQLFEKYRQTSSGKQSYEGTGLGLVICKMIVEAHGGKICVKSEEGTTFTFTIPY